MLVKAYNFINSSVAGQYAISSQTSKIELIAKTVNGLRYFNKKHHLMFHQAPNMFVHDNLTFLKNVI